MLSSPRIYDILVIGTGAAGLGLALSLADRFRVAIVCKDDGLTSSSQYAQGGIAAVMDETDSVESHIQDTLIAGAGLCDKNACEFILKNGRRAIEWLMLRGVQFTLKSDNPVLHLTQEGGHSHRRVVHADDKTGAVVVKTLAQQVSDHKNIDCFPEHTAIDLICEKSICFGAKFLNNATGKIELFLAKHTVIATGGASHMYAHTSSPGHTTGDGIAMAYRAGCRIANMEFNQFHPTSFYRPRGRPFLITEAMRGEGAKLTLPNGQRFMPRYDERAELAPRDIVARAIDSEMKKHKLTHVYLDISHKPAEFIKQYFPTIYAHCLKAGIDITKDPIPVVPAAHYSCGGIMTNLNGETDVANLFAIGEVACTGLHGANRMASNSLLECVVMAMSAAQKIEAYHCESSKQSIHEKSSAPIDSSLAMKEIDRHGRRLPRDDKAISIMKRIRQIMWQDVGIVRNTKGLESAVTKLTKIKNKIEENWPPNEFSRQLIEARNLATCAYLAASMALARHESRGLHFTTDFPSARPIAENNVLSF